MNKINDLDYEQIVALYHQGKSLKEISKIYEVHRATISRLLNKHGIVTDKIVIPNALEPIVLAYYAGVFDGEGHITIGASKRPERTDYWLQIGIVNTYRPLLESLQKDFGVGHLSQLYGSGKGNRLPCWAWRCTSNQAMLVLEALLPFLRMKLEPAKLAIEFQSYSKYRPDKQWQLSMKQQISGLNDLS